MNYAILTGRLTKDVDLRQTTTGKPVTTFTLAVDRRKKDDGADFISCVAWNETATAMAKFLRKGSKILVAGRISCRSFERNGEKRYVTEIIAETVEFLDRKKAEAPEFTEEADDPDGQPI